MRRLFLLTLASVIFLTNVFATITSHKLNQDCVAVLDNLISATTNASSLGTKDKEGLLAKATGAKSDYVAGKTADALKKLNDYGAKLSQLEATAGSAKAKISPSDAQALRTALNAAITCLSA